MGLAIVGFSAALVIAGFDAASRFRLAMSLAISIIGLAAAAVLAVRAWATVRTQAAHALWALLLAYCTLLVAPASQLYARVNGWQDLAKISRAVQLDTTGRPLVLLAPDETTRAIVDMYARTSAARVDGPIDAAWIDRVRSMTKAAPDSFFLALLPSQSPQLPWRAKPKATVAPPWIDAANLQWVESYALPNGRRYALLVSAGNQTAIQ
jgi:hypothetical protein